MNLGKITLNAFVFCATIFSFAQAQESVEKNKSASEQKMTAKQVADLNKTNVDGVEISLKVGQTVDGTKIPVAKITKLASADTTKANTDTGADDWDDGDTDDISDLELAYNKNQASHQANQASHVKNQALHAKKRKLDKVIASQ